jgi:hypothetical protein
VYPRNRGWLPSQEGCNSLPIVSPYDENCHQGWQTLVYAPRGSQTEVCYTNIRRLWECETKHPKRQFSVKLRTVFEDLPIALDHGPRRLVNR